MIGERRTVVLHAPNRATKRAPKRSSGQPTAAHSPRAFQRVAVIAVARAVIPIKT